MALLAAVVVFAVVGDVRPMTLYAGEQRTAADEAPSNRVVRQAEDPTPPPTLSIAKFHINSEIQFRYARTSIESQVKNAGQEAAETSFSVIIPDAAFVSNFSMTIAGKTFGAKVEKKEDAEEKYRTAIDSGQSAGLVQQDVRDANKFTVSANVEPAQKVVFKLHYDEHLQRRIGKYEQLIHVNPGQPVADFRIDVVINESRPVINVLVPPLKRDVNAITPHTQNENAKIEYVNDVVHITYKLSEQEQTGLDGKYEAGVNGQLLVQYDVDRKGQNSEIQVVDGYFVHFFAPDNLKTLPKHVVFILDVSGSMFGEKLKQTKDAMITIISDLSGQDFFNILTFSDEVYSWENQQTSALRAHNDRKSAAKKYVLGLETLGGTNINDGLLNGIALAKTVSESGELPADVTPLIIFMTDGQATTGVTSSGQIKNNAKNANDVNIPIYGLAFGQGADFNLIKDMSLQNQAYARKIYEGSDAAIQLEDFYLEISSPLLTNLNFNYVGEAIENDDITPVSRSTFFRGGEYVIAGKLRTAPPTGTDVGSFINATVSGGGLGGSSFTSEINFCNCVSLHVALCPLPIIVYSGEDAGTRSGDRPLLPPRCPAPRPRPPQSKAQNFLERLWAFLTVRDLLRAKTDEGNEKAVELALEYNFVTPLTSLIVTRPVANDSSKTVEEISELTDPSSRDDTRFFAVAPASYPLPRLAGSYQPPFSNFLALPIGTRSFKLAGGAPFAAPPPPQNATGLAPPQFEEPLGFELAEPQSDQPDLDEYYDYSLASQTTLTAPESSCSADNSTLTLFDKTYLRGNSVTIDDDAVDDLANDDFAFDNKLTSLRVSGTCCWRIYADAGLLGDSEKFAPGEFISATDMGILFEEASSAKRIAC